MYLVEKTNKPLYEKIVFSCDVCGRKVESLLISAERNFQRNGIHVCVNCSCSKNAHKKPQCNKNYWDENKKKAHGNKIKKSEKYINAIEKRDTTGENNGMFGKKCLQKHVKKCL